MNSEIQRFIEGQVSNGLGIKEGTVAGEAFPKHHEAENVIGVLARLIEMDYWIYPSTRSIGLESLQAIAWAGGRFGLGVDMGVTPAGFTKKAFKNSRYLIDRYRKAKRKIDGISSQDITRAYSRGYTAGEREGRKEGVQYGRRLEQLSRRVGRDLFELIKESNPDGSLPLILDSKICDLDQYAKKPGFLSKIGDFIIRH